MMICPETYYELYLKEKTAEEIFSAIRGLKNEIGRLKNIVEHPEYECRMHPSEKVRISCNREYLERAKQALADVGVEYQPSKAESKASEFNKNIPNIRKITLSIGGYFYGIDVFEIVVGETRVDFIFSHSDTPTIIDNFEFRYDCDKIKFFELFQRLHIGEWRNNYNTSRFGYTVCDGTQWELEINYSNGMKPVIIHGNNAYPYNFDELKELLGCDDLEADNL